MQVNDQPFGRGLTGRKIWLKIQKRCQNIESLKNRSVNSLKFRFLEHIKPKLSDVNILFYSFIILTNYIIT